MATPSQLVLQKPKIGNVYPQDFLSIDFYENKNEFLLELENSFGDQVANWLTIEDAEKLRNYLNEKLKGIVKCQH
jgi:thermostable 8-oxoguanine DNA glycosylase